MILGFSRRVAFDPGSNLSGVAAPPVWAYLLPRLDDVRIVFVGRIDPHVRAGLLPWHDDTGDTPLLVVGDASEREIRRALEEHPDAAVFATDSAADEIGGTLGTTDRWLTASGPGAGEAAGPSDGDARTALRVPAAPPGGGGRMAQLGARALRVSGRLARRLGFGKTDGVAADDPTGVPLAPSAERPLHRASRGLFVPPGGVDVRLVPDWIRTIARGEGTDLAGASWRVIPSRGYRSQKVLFLVTPPEGPPVAVKVTQDPAFNVRLYNEHDGLAALASLDGILPGTFPRPLFRGEHRGLAVVAEEAVGGAPFRALSDGTTACPHARKALEWLEAVAVASSSPASGADVADAASELVERFLLRYRPPARIERTLRADLEEIGASGRVPTVLAHGDPGVWNLLVRSEGRVVFLDWENTEPRGLPLWDVLYFLRTLGALHAEKNGVRWTPRVFARQFLGPSEWSSLLAAQVDTHARRLGFDPELAPALLRTGLAAFAAREAWSLDPRRLERGVSVRLLRTVIEGGHGSTSWRRVLLAR